MKTQLLIPDRKILTRVFLILGLLSHPTVIQAHSSSVFAEMAEKTGGTAIMLPKPKEGEEDDTVWCTAFNIIMGTMRPTITAITPLKIPLDSTVDLLITAPNANFNSSSVVRIENSNITINEITVQSATKIRASISVPTTAARQFYDVFVDTTVGTEKESAQGKCALEVVEKPSTPLILSINPSKVQQNATVDIELKGINTDFKTGSVLQIGTGITGTVTEVISPTHLKASVQVDETANTGFYHVTVNTDSQVARDTQPGGALLVLSDAYKIPEIKSITPSQVGQGKTVTVELSAADTNFTSSSTLSFSGEGVTATSTDVKTTTSITATVAINKEAPAGYRDVFVTTGAEIASLLKGFEIQLNAEPTDIALSNTEIAETSATDSVVGTLSTTDADTTDTHTYQLEDSAGGRFKIVGNELKVADNSLLIANQQETHRIKVISTDDGGQTYGKHLAINIKYAPKDITLSKNTVIERSGIGIVGALSAADPNLTNTHTYTLLDDAEGIFKLDDNNNVLVANSAALKKGQYPITVRATDNTGMTFDKTLTINVTDDPTPTDITYSTSIAKDISLSTLIAVVHTPEKTTLAELSTVDPSSNDTHTYTFIDDAHANERFKLDGNKLIANQALDQVDHYEIKIRTTDSAALTFDKTFTITVKNLTLTNNTVSENSKSGTEIGQLSITLPYGGDTVHTYLLKDDKGGLFKLDGKRLLVSNDSLLKIGDYGLIIRSTEKEQPKLFFEKSVTIQVITDDTGENLPPTAITLSNNTVAVNTTPGTTVGNFVTSDPNVGDKHSYTLIENAGDRFIIVDNSLVNSVSLEAGQYIITVGSTDSGGLSFEKEFIITAKAATPPTVVPDAGPKSPPPNAAPTSITLSNNTLTANSVLGTPIGSFTTVDPDINDTHTYTLEHDSERRFAITGNQLQIAKTLEIGNHEITVRSTDSGGLSIDQTFQIDIVAASEDQDNDGILNYLEEAAPNNGDGNDDGIPDSEQPHVVSLPLNNQQDYITLAAHNTDCPLEKVHVNNVQSQPDTHHPAESIRFEIACQATELTLYYHGVTDPSGWAYQHYQDNAWQEMPNVQLDQQFSSDQTVTTATLSLEAESDADHIVHIGGLSRQQLTTTTLHFAKNSLVINEYGNSVTTLPTLGQVEGNLISLPVTRSGAIDKIVKAHFVSIDSDARQAIDYAIVSPKNGQITWPKGDTTANITLIVINDDIDESDESFRLRLSNPTDGAQIGTPSEIAITIKGTQIEEPIEAKPTTECKRDDPTLLLSAPKNITLKVGDDPITLNFTGGQDIDDQDKRALSESPDSEIVSIESAIFPREGGAIVTLRPVAPGQTSLVISDCLSEAEVDITVEPALCQNDPAKALQPETEELSIELGTGSYRLPITGGQGDITVKQPHHTEVATGELLFTKEETFLEIRPKQLGHTYFTLSDCNSETLIDVSVKSQCDNLQANAAQTLKMNSDPEIILIADAEKRMIEVSGGQGALQLNSQNSSVAAGNLVLSQNGTAILIVRPIKPGHATFTINDCVSQIELFVSVLPDAPNTVGIDPNNQIFTDTQAYFEINLQKTGGKASDDNWYGPSDSLMLNLNLIIAPKHVGQAAGLIALIIPEGREIVFMHNGSKWLRWDGDILSFPVTKTYAHLPSPVKNAITLELDTLPLDGFLGKTFNVYIGYRLGDGTIIFSTDENAPRFKVANGSGLKLQGDKIATFATTAHFEGLLSSDSGQTGNNLLIGRTETLAAQFTINVDPAHQGQRASLILVAEHSNGQLLMHNGQNWETWDKQFASLIPAKPPYESLPEKLSITLYPLNLDKPIGEWQLNIAYRLEDGDEQGAIIFNNPLKFSIANGVGRSLISYEAINTATHFHVQISTESGLSGNNLEILETETAAIEYSLQIDPADIGQAAQIIITAQVSFEEGTEQAVFIHNGQTWKAWNDDLNKLTPTQIHDKLPKLLNGQQPLALKSLALGDKLPAALKIYIGYKLGNENFIYNEDTPLYLRVIQAPSGPESSERPCLFCM